LSFYFAVRFSFFRILFFEVHIVYGFYRLLIIFEENLFMRFLFFFFVPFFFTFGQQKIEHQNQLWYGYYLTYSINKQWYLQGEAHERHFISPVLHHQTAFRAHLHRNFGKNWEFSAGAALFLNTPNDPAATVRLAIPEYRPHFEGLYKHNWSKLRVDHRFRAEMRFNQAANAARTALDESINFSNYRLRYRIQVLFPLLKSISGKVNTEILLNAAQENPENDLDQHRMFAGLSIPLRTNLALDVGYLHAFQQRPNLNYYDRSIISMMLYHRIK